MSAGFKHHARHPLLRVCLTALLLQPQLSTEGLHLRQELGFVVECGNNHVTALVALWVKAVVTQYEPQDVVVVRVYVRHRRRIASPINLCKHERALVPLMERSCR